MEMIEKEELNTIIFELLNLERKNLRSRAKTDQAMAEELMKVIISYSKII